jgi:ABC-type uncharacterized transport system substrate-binding protein
MRQYATELVASAPDVILAFGTVAARAIERESREVPIVFVNAADRDWSKASNDREDRRRVFFPSKPA